MKSQSKIHGLSILIVSVLATTISSLPEAFAEGASTGSAPRICPHYAQPKLANEWQGLKTGHGLELSEATYNGKGRTTGQRYMLHVRRFHMREDLYVAVLENRKTNKAWLGVLERSDEGVYNWRNLIFGTGLSSIDVDFIQSPVFRFEFELDNRARPKRLVGSSLDRASNAESIEFTSMRPSRLGMDLGAGVWKNKAMSLTLIPRAESSSCPTPASYSAKLFNKAEIGSSAMPLELRPSLLAGVYTAHEVLEANYERRAQLTIIAVAVHLLGHSEGTWNMTDVNERVLFFDYLSKNEREAVEIDRPKRLGR